MERTVTIFHEGALAHYNVLLNGDGTFKARLLTYNGNRTNTPPREFHLQKDGRRWSQEAGANKDLADELGYVIDMQKGFFEQPRYATADWLEHRPDRA